MVTVGDSGGKGPARARAGTREISEEKCSVPLRTEMLRIKVKLLEALQALLSRTFSPVGYVACAGAVCDRGKIAVLGCEVGSGSEWSSARQ